jgi:UDP-N-acetylmuramoylalanine--D-glutamate ligase
LLEKPIIIKNIMSLQNLKNKNICILGFGIENQALLRFLLGEKIDCQITVCDANRLEKKNYDALSRKNIKIIIGPSYDKNLNQFDLIFRIAGYPLFSEELRTATKAGAVITSPTKLFFELCPSKNIIGVTGTKGKGTTSSLITHIIKKAGLKVWLGGNIGTPMFSFFNKIKPSDYVVLELSSFQLEDLRKSPHISVITNFSQEHLAPADPNNPNYHRSLKDYWRAKANIFKWQTEKDYLLASPDLRPVIEKEEIKSRIIYFEQADSAGNLAGEYNKKNVGAAMEAAKILKIKKDITQNAIKSFKGLPHRIELVREVGGVKYYDNSFATTPEATIEDLKSFNNPIILFLGGADKGSNFKDLARTVKKANIKLVILLSGLATPKIKKELIKVGIEAKKMKSADGMAEAVEIARQKAEVGDMVLLSTACASFGMFKNYKERGDMFKQEVNKIIDK